MKFYEYIKKHKVVNDEDLAFVKEREDNLYGDQEHRPHVSDRFQLCLLYTSDAADEEVV